MNKKALIKITFTASEVVHNVAANWQDDYDSFEEWVDAIRQDYFDDSKLIKEMVNDYPQNLEVEVEYE